MRSARWQRRTKSGPHRQKRRAIAIQRSEYLIAYDCQHVARYPAPNSPGKLAAYRKSQEYFLKAARYFDPPLERVEMPFAGRAGEGKIAVGLLRKPKRVAKPPVVVVWGGIDAFKEERASEPYLKAGLAPLAIDMPGVADAPLAGSENGERLWDAVFDFIASRSDLDSDRVGAPGGSMSGWLLGDESGAHACAAIARGGEPRRSVPFRISKGLDCQRAAR